MESIIFPPGRVEPEEVTFCEAFYHDINNSHQVTIKFGSYASEAAFCQDIVAGQIISIERNRISQIG